jgi:hypothetical protein
VNQIAALLLTQAALTALCLAMPKHHAQVWQHEGSPGRRTLLRAAGWLALWLAAAICVVADGVGVGLVLWCALLTVAGSVVAWLLPYRPRWIPVLGVGALLAGAAAALAAFGWLGR